MGDVDGPAVGNRDRSIKGSVRVLGEVRRGLLEGLRLGARGPRRVGGLLRVLEVGFTVMHLTMCLISQELADRRSVLRGCRVCSGDIGVALGTPGRRGHER